MFNQEQQQNSVLLCKISGIHSDSLSKNITASTGHLFAYLFIHLLLITYWFWENQSETELTSYLGYSSTVQDWDRVWERQLPGSLVQWRKKGTEPSWWWKDRKSAWVYDMKHTLKSIFFWGAPVPSGGISNSDEENKKIQIKMIALTPENMKTV